MKFNIKAAVGTIEVNGLVLKDIKVEVGGEYSVGELKGCYELARKVIKELPQTLEDLAAGALEFDKLDKMFDSLVTEDSIIRKQREDLARAKGESYSEPSSRYKEHSLKDRPEDKEDSKKDISELFQDILNICIKS